MAAPPSAMLAHCLELLAPLGAVRARRMFGGHGLYLDGLFIAILAGDTLYLKADADEQPAFAAAGSQPFTYTARGDRRVVMAYWAAPEQAMDSPAGMAPWARRALASALRAAASKAVPAQRKPRAKPPQVAGAAAPANPRGAARPPAKRRGRQG